MDMALKDIIDTIRKIGNKEEEEEDYVPRQVIDRHLDSLRRQRQTQLNEVERYKLKKDIAKYNKERERKYLWGLKNNLLMEKKRYLGKIKKKASVLRKQKMILESRSLLNNRKDEFRKTKVDILKARNSILK